jgi:hypothetical protein
MEGDRDDVQSRTVETPHDARAIPHFVRYRCPSTTEETNG